MAREPWNVANGFVVVAIWSFVVGVPLLFFHARGDALQWGDHLHAFVLFAVSQVLVFWFVARSQPMRKRAAITREPSPDGIHAGIMYYNAEVVEAEWRPRRRSPEAGGWVDESTREGAAGSASSGGVPEFLGGASFASQPAISGSNGSSRSPATRLSITSYLGSSQQRRVSVDPPGRKWTLLPGQTLEVTVTCRVGLPAIEITESDLMTQVSVTGIGVQTEMRVLLPGSESVSH